MRKKPSRESTARLLYIPRAIGCLCTLAILASIFYKESNYLLWTSMIAHGLLWPHMAYLRNLHSDHIKKTEMQNLLIDSFIIGIWTNVFHYDLLPLLALNISVLLDNIAAGGRRLMAIGIFLTLLGNILSGLVLGFGLATESTYLTNLISSICLMLFIIVVGNASYNVTVRLKKAKKILEERTHQLGKTLAKSEELTQEAKSASKMKSNFLANMSHEIRTPMNGIIGMSDLMTETQLNEEQQELLRIIKYSADSLLNIMNDILDFSKIEACKLELEVIDFDLRTSMEEITDLLSIKAEENKLELACLVHHGVPSLLKGDPGRIRQIIINLVGNAIKFSTCGAVIINVTSIEDTYQACTLRFEVIDKGIGIPQQDLKKLFKPFSQVDDSTTRQFGGTGLGLVISKQLAEMMNGSMGVESEVGKGSTFWFTIKFQKQTDIPQVINKSLDLHGKQILVADDFSTNRRIITNYLDEWGVHHEEAENGPKAIEKFMRTHNNNDPYDIIIIDLMMSDMNGLMVAEKIRAFDTTGHTKLIMLTSMGKRGDAKKAQSAGLSAYLTKPIKKTQLYNCIVTVLNLEPLETSISKEPTIITRHSLNENKHFSILLVEDNIVNQQLVLKLLNKFGLSVNVASNGIEAIETLKSTHYDIILMDIQMPEMGGIEATRIIRNPETGMSNPAIPIIAITARAMKGDKEKCLEAGMNDYISKPINTNKLLSTLNEHLNTTL